MNTLIILFLVPSLLLGGVGLGIGLLVQKYNPRGAHLLLYVALLGSLLPIFGHYDATLDGSGEALTYMKERTERFSDQEIAGTASAHSWFMYSVPVWCLGLYLLCCFLSTYHVLGGLFLPAVAFVLYYHGSYDVLADALGRHGGIDAVTRLPENTNMIWAFILSSGAQVGLCTYAWCLSRQSDSDRAGPSSTA